MAGGQVTCGIRLHFMNCMTGPPLVLDFDPGCPINIIHHAEILGNRTIVSNKLKHIMIVNIRIVEFTYIYHDS